MKVGEQALYLAQLKGMSKNDALKSLKHWFEKFEIQAWWNKKVEELSKGMQQKVQFITTVMHKPKLLIFDEPFSGFDPINTNLLKNEILNLKEQGATIIFSTHNMASVEEVCDHIALINQSKKILDGEIDTISEQYKSDVFEIETTAPFDVTAEFSRNGFQLIDYNLKGKLQTVKFQVVDRESNPNDFSSKTDAANGNPFIPRSDSLHERSIYPSCRTSEPQKTNPMNKSILILKREYLTRVRKKSFIILTLLVPFIFAAFTILPAWLAMQDDEEQRTIGVYDASNAFLDRLENTEYTKFQFIPKETYEAAKEHIKSSDFYAILYIPSNILITNQAQLISGKQVTFDIKNMIGNRLDT